MKRFLLFLIIGTLFNVQAFASQNCSQLESQKLRSSMALELTKEYEVNLFEIYKDAKRDSNLSTTLFTGSAMVLGVSAGLLAKLAATPSLAAGQWGLVSSLTYYPAIFPASLVPAVLFGSSSSLMAPVTALLFGAEFMIPVAYGVNQIDYKLVSENNDPLVDADLDMIVTLSDFDLEIAKSKILEIKNLWQDKRPELVEQTLLERIRDGLSLGAREAANHEVRYVWALGNTKIHKALYQLDKASLNSCLNSEK